MKNVRWMMAAVASVGLMLGSIGCSSEEDVLGDSDPNGGARPGTSGGTTSGGSSSGGSSSGGTTSGGTTSGGTSSGGTSSGGSSSGGSSSGGSSSGGSSSGGASGECLQITAIDTSETYAPYCTDEECTGVFPFYYFSFSPAVDGKAYNDIGFMFDPEVLALNTAATFQFGSEDMFLFTQSYNDEEDASPAFFEVEAGSVTVSSYTEASGAVNFALSNIRMVESTYDDAGAPVRVANGRCAEINSLNVAWAGEPAQ